MYRNHTTPIASGPPLAGLPTSPDARAAASAASYVIEGHAESLADAALGFAGSLQALQVRASTEGPVHEVLGELGFTAAPEAYAADARASLAHLRQVVAEITAEIETIDRVCPAPAQLREVC